ncbi:LacI family transcriptional regulator [Microlunatus elymi]|uniref:LacI family transcriptional regulator n=1 Tax=Microlunatus elymi TaxID=2596828 RepID=A0A516Q186_9ACTN|nr:LacI family DNA-binding transcriptional regulator [Microlunatus elymi]QDP97199.1 LacI family transcriptional regulator [Microlunatus elymi]
MKMVAERCGVSVATVSFVLSGRRSGQVAASAATAERIRTVAAELGYRPNHAARAIRTGRSGLVLLSLTQLSDPWCQSVSHAVNEASADRHLQPLILADGDWGEVLDTQPVDAAFLDAGTGADLDRIRGLVRRGLRLIVFSDDLEPDGFDVIRSPQQPGCGLAMEHLLADHVRIGCLTGSDPSRPGWHREDAYFAALQEAGIKPESDHLQRYTHDLAGVYDAALRLLDRADPPTAVFASSDFAAITVINVALRLGMSVPDDLAVVGVGNTEEGTQLHPSLTSVGPTEFFSTLADLIIQLAERPDDHQPTRHDFPWQLHRRESS